MKTYLANILINLKLTSRDRLAVFFGYAFPLAFFFLFAQAARAEQGGAIIQCVSMVLIIGILGNGFFGAGIRAVQDRELNILRRYKVTPTSAAPILVSSLVTGWVYYMPAVILTFLLAHFIYGMPVPSRLGTLFLFLTIANLAFRSMGLIIAALVNSMQEAQIVIQLFYLPMLFLSGATFPVSSMPAWVQVLAQFLPASYLYTGMQGVLIRKESLADNASSVAALLLTFGVALLLGVKLFRWEKEEKMRPAAKLWLAAVLAPFLLLGGWQAYSRDNLTKSKVLFRELRRDRTMLIRGARIFTGDGPVIESGAVLIRSGRIAEIYRGSAPDPRALKAEVIESAGKTLLPGLIDTHVHIGAPGGIQQTTPQPPSHAVFERQLLSYIYSGITSVRSAGDSLRFVKRLRDTAEGGEHIGAELFFCGPLFTVEGGHGTQFFQSLPPNVRAVVEQDALRLPKTPSEARAQVAELKRQGVHAIKVILEAGTAARLFNRMDVAILRAIGEEARAHALRLAVHTGDDRDVRDAIEVGANTIEHGSARERISDENLRLMAQRGIAYAPTLTVVEAARDLAEGKLDLMNRSLVQQVGPASLLEGTRRFLTSPEAASVRERFRAAALNFETASANLRRAHAAGVMLVTGSDAGNLLVIHGPTIHRELQLMVKAGIPASAALQAATANSANALGASHRMGSIRKGLEATLLLVDGNPLEDITMTERISVVMLRGERAIRTQLFEQ